MCFFWCEQTLPAGDLQSFPVPSECPVCFETLLGLGSLLSHLVIKPLVGPGGSRSTYLIISARNCRGLWLPLPRGSNESIEERDLCTKGNLHCDKKGRWPVLEGTQETSVLPRYTERWGNWASPFTSLENY